MYLQITTRCNMLCPHCCFSCTNKGEDMSQEVFSLALELASDRVPTICIGGGEPTIHPLFREFIMEALDTMDWEDEVHIITNGKAVKNALWLAGTIKDNENLNGELSLDKYHEPITQQVIDAFRALSQMVPSHSLKDWHPNIRNTTFAYGPSAQGRGADLTDARKDGICMCDTLLLIKPNGDIVNIRVPIFERMTGHHLA